MSEEIKGTPTEVTSETGQKTRRAFVKTAAQVAVTAPAVAVLLNASTASAQVVSLYTATLLHAIDDGLSGNASEDLFFLTQDGTGDTGGPGMTFSGDLPGGFGTP
jgi:hypothetical protein